MYMWEPILNHMFTPISRYNMQIQYNMHVHMHMYTAGGPPHVNLRTSPRNDSSGHKCAGHRFAQWRSSDPKASRQPAAQSKAQHFRWLVQNSYPLNIQPLSKTRSSSTTLRIWQTQCQNNLPWLEMVNVHHPSMAKIGINHPLPFI